MRKAGGQRLHLCDETETIYFPHDGTPSVQANPVRGCGSGFKRSINEHRSLIISQFTNLLYLRYIPPPASGCQSLGERVVAAAAAAAAEARL